MSYFDVRWACPTCGRFLPESAIRSWDVLDPGEYYGVRGVIVGDCARCGEVGEPRLIQTREIADREEDCPGPIPGHGCGYCRSDEELHPERYVS